MTEHRARRNELKAFLRARRAAISPEESGLPRSKRRLTPGLRREELAVIANVGVTWYTWLEQGRDINVSPDTLHRIARALRLSASDENYLLSLAGISPPRAAERGPVRPPNVQLVLDGFSTGSALLLDAMANVLAFNPIADVVFTFGAYDGPFANNHIWRAFMDPARRQLYVLTEEVLRNFIGVFRTLSAGVVGDPQFDAMIAALIEGSPDFRRLWNQQQTEPLAADLPLRVRHPTLGPMNLCSIRLLMPHFPGTLLLLAPADAEAQRAMAYAAELASKARQSSHR